MSLGERLEERESIVNYIKFYVDKLNERGDVKSRELGQVQRS